MRIFITLILLGISQGLSAGNNTVTTSGVEHLNPFGARRFCNPESNVYEENFSMEFFSLPCNGLVTFYYQFRTVAEVADLEFAEVITSTNSTYRLFGPFSNVTEGALQIVQLAAPEVASGTATNVHSVEFDSKEGQVYILAVTVQACTGSLKITVDAESIMCSEKIDCKTCIPSFNPGPGKYVLSGWVKEDNAPPTKTSYDLPSIVISFPSVPLTSYTFHPSGQIIDGWQRIESIFEVPPGSSSVKLKLQVTAGEAFFDDIRLFPFDGSMISYVYDPLTLRLVAELDERNYAKIYEYDEEGKLTRIKKETEKGIMTIQENREGSKKL